jgi:environmental stress-induced protein Ves
MRVQRFGEHLAMPWANGKGTSYEIASDRDASNQWTWRVAIAPVVEDGPFSTLPGIDRQLVVIDGNGMVLEVDGKTVECPSGQVVSFSGDSTTSARLINGPIVDVGLMTVKGLYAGSMSVVTGVGSVIESDLIVAIGDTNVEDESGVQYGLETMDALLGVERRRMVLLNGMAIAIQVKPL